MSIFRVSLAILSALAAVGGSFAQAPTKDVTYWQDIRPIFRKHCTVCHGTRYLKKPDVSGGLALDGFEVAMKGATRPVIVAGKSGASLLVELITTTDLRKRMPLDGDALPKESIDLIRRWIDSGAKAGT